ncbi:MULTISPECIES: transcriptional regulator [Photorhabdus]|uniref:Transcriptional regulator n=1 Tax=Photorhabdus luminescens subsp. mexicana TaxID=2100167 RepID=A0A4R4JQL9_PHOLU|nr:MULTISPECIES: transcriptional regulator [Photorhabdus]MCW7548542.1 transcriptional regulator [Photorhabdus aballayi]MCW7761026.1 transcriptional regulator [Photorhabdus luminescens subsp. venezuelensis]TDB56286.1 transcriptional regulator [Photorhabdus luminescens subsp. mexicana]
MLLGNLKTIANLKTGDIVNININEEGAVIQKVVKKRLTESDLLNGLSAYTAHADELAAPSHKELDG